MTLSSSTPNPVRPIGSAVTLTCTVHVELSPEVDVPVAVNIVIETWIRSHRFLVTNASQLVLGGTTVYNFTAIVSSIGRNQSGSYGCLGTLYSASANAYVHESIIIYGLIEITTGEIIISCPFY